MANAWTLPNWSPPEVGAETIYGYCLFLIKLACHWSLITTWLFSLRLVLCMVSSSSPMVKDRCNSYSYTELSSQTGGDRKGPKEKKCSGDKTEKYISQWTNFIHLFDKKFSVMLRFFYNAEINNQSQAGEHPSHKQRREQTFMHTPACLMYS